MPPESSPESELKPPDPPKNVRVKVDRVETTEKWIAAAATLAALAGLVAGATNFLITRHQHETAGDVSFINARLAYVDDKVVELQKNADSMRVLADKLASAAPANVQITSLSTQVASLQTQVKLLNDAISQHPERVLSVPLLREDLDNLKESYRREQDNMQIELNRSYDLSKWLVLLMIPIVLALVSLVAGTFRQSHKTGSS